MQKAFKKRKKEMKASQNSRILKYLMSGKRLNPLQALTKFGTFRLASRIRNLKDDGFDILTTMVTKNKKRFAEYSLIDPYRPL